VIIHNLLVQEWRHIHGRSRQLVIGVRPQIKKCRTASFIDEITQFVQDAHTSRGSHVARGDDVIGMFHQIVSIFLNGIADFSGFPVESGTSNERSSPYPMGENHEYSAR